MPLARLYTRTNGVSTIDGAKDDAEWDNIITTYNAHIVSANTHGVAGSIVGTNNVQTLTNKTLSSPTITGSPTAVGVTWANLGTVTTGAITTLSTATNFTAGLTVASTQSIGFEGAGGDTYINAPAANRLAFVIGGTEDFHFEHDATSPFFWVKAGGKIYLDGGNDTYIYESGANTIKAFCGGTERLQLDSTGAWFSSIPVILSATQKLYLDGGTESYIAETAADTVDIVAGGTTIASFKETSAGNGEVLLDDVDPPTANYANRNGIVKGWVRCGATGVTDASYNVSSTSRTADPGVYEVVWDTDFASLTNVSVASSVAGTVNAVIVSTFQSAAGICDVRTYDSAAVLGNNAFYLIATGVQ